MKIRLAQCKVGAWGAGWSELCFIIERFYDNKFDMSTPCWKNYNERRSMDTLFNGIEGSTYGVVYEGNI